MSFLFGGEEEVKQTQTSTPQYPEQALQLFQRELDLLENTLFPLQQQNLQQQMELIMGGGQNSPVLKGARMAGPALAGMPGGSGAMGQAPLDPTIQAILGQLQAQAPSVLASQVQSLMPPQYAQLFQPSMTTTTETDQPGPSPFEVVVGLGSLATPIIAACWVADALYGEGSIKAMMARLWVSEGWQGRQGRLFLWVYRRIGPAVAKLVPKSKRLRGWLEPVFDRFAERGLDYFVRTRIPIWS